MSEKTIELLAYCGLYCGACSFRVAFRENNRGHLGGMPAKYDSLKNLEMSDCQGCRADSACGDCGIKECARGKGLIHCGDCPSYPCERIQAFAGDGIPHHADVTKNFAEIRAVGVETWLRQQDQAFTCPCGKRLSWYAATCVHQ